jgi:endo-1,3-1,4-beta-glycanase ExoK
VLGTYGYGRYETIMRPAKGSGLVSAFFTYTGPYFGKPHDEIDIEFVGKDTSIVELNYFHKGKTGSSARIKLPFDASEQDHLYAFDWKPEGISWYVDGKLIYQTPVNDPHLPKNAGRL